MLWGIIYGYIKSGMKFSPLYRLDKIPTGSNEPARNSPAAESAKGRIQHCTKKSDDTEDEVLKKKYDDMQRQAVILVLG